MNSTSDTSQATFLNSAWYFSFFSVFVLLYFLLSACHCQMSPRTNKTVQVCACQAACGTCRYMLLVIPISSLPAVRTYSPRAENSGEMSWRRAASSSSTPATPEEGGGAARLPGPAPSQPHGDHPPCLQYTHTPEHEPTPGY